MHLLLRTRRIRNFSPNTNPELLFRAVKLLPLKNYKNIITDDLQVHSPTYSNTDITTVAKTNFFFKFQKRFLTKRNLMLISNYLKAESGTEIHNFGSTAQPVS